MTKEINWDEVTLAPMEPRAENGESDTEQESLVSEVEPIAEFVPVQEEMRAPEVIAHEEAQVAEMQKEIKETLKEQELVKTEVAQVSKAISMEERIRPNIPEVPGDSFVNQYDYEGTAVGEASGGLIEYAKNSKQNKFGFEFEGMGEIPPERLEELKANLENSEAGKSKEAFDYVEVPDGAWSAESTKNLKLNDGENFSYALDAKKMYNASKRKKFFLSSLGGAATAVVGGLGTVAVGGAGTATAALGLGIMGIGGGAFLALGGLGWAGKKIYDSYKEKKAVKNFMTASVAQNMRKSLAGGV